MRGRSGGADLRQDQSRREKNPAVKRNFTFLLGFIKKYSSEAPSLLQKGANESKAIPCQLSPKTFAIPGFCH